MKGWIELRDCHNKTFCMQIDKIISIHYDREDSEFTMIYVVASDFSADGCYLVNMTYNEVLQRVAEAIQ